MNPYETAITEEVDVDDFIEIERQKKSCNPETAALLGKVSRLERRVAELEARKENATDWAGSSTSTDADTSESNFDLNPQRLSVRPPRFGGLFRLNEEGEEEETAQELHEDTYSFILASPLCGYSFSLGILVFFTQMVVFLLMLWSLTGYDPEGNPQSGNTFGIPVNVDPEVRLAQMVALAFTVVTQTDVIKGLDLMRLIGNESFKEAVPHHHTWRIILCIVTPLLEGSVGILVSFILIVTSETVFYLLLNFTAMAFLSELDEAVFFVTRYGFFGVTCEADAETVKSITYKVHKKLHRRREIVLLVVMFVALVSGWSVAVFKQNQGHYQCSTVLVQMGDDIQPALGTFSGLYDLQEPERAGVLRSQYMVYVERRSGKASFVYCHDLQAWTFTWHEDGDDPCDSWVAMSSQTLSYDITDTSSLTWYARDQHSRVVVLDPFFLDCYDCDNGGKDSECTGRGSCSNAVCDCDDGSFGLRCEFEEPCPFLAMDARTSGFLGTRPWSGSYELLQVITTTTGIVPGVNDSVLADPNQTVTNATSANNTVAKGSFVSGMAGVVQVYHRPVYIHEYQEGLFDLIFFTGRRWVVTYSDFLHLENSSVTHNISNPKLQLARYFEEDFHAHWSSFSIAFISEPVDVATPNDANSPMDLTFYQAATQNSAEQAEIQGVGGLPNDVRLLCAVCDNTTNPCAYDGKCTVTGTCFCPMSQGALCEIPPVGNGHCDTYYNTPQYNFDDGDCCAQTCVSDAEFSCGMDSSGYGSTGYPFCKEFLSNQWIPDGVSWADFNAVALSDDGTFLVVSSSERGHAQMFDKVGKDWFQRGPPVVVKHRTHAVGDPVNLAIASLSPAMVNTPSMRPPYLVFFPDLRDGDDSKINVVSCESTCGVVEMQEPLYVGPSTVHTVSSDGPYLALRNGTDQRVHVFDLREAPVPRYFATVGEDLGRITSISLSATGETLAVQASWSPWAHPANYTVHVYDWNYVSELYEERHSPLEFHGVKDFSGRHSSPLSVSGDGNVVAFSEAFDVAGVGNGSSVVQIYTWDHGTKNLSRLGDFPLIGHYMQPGGNGASSLSRDGKTLLYVDGANASVFDWDGVVWSLVGQSLSSFFPEFNHLRANSMNGDGSVVALGMEEYEDGAWTSGTQTAHVLSVPERKCHDGVSLRVSLTTDRYPDTKSWTLVANDTGKVLFQRDFGAFRKDLGATLYNSATYAYQGCVQKDSCHLLSIYAHGYDEFRPPGGYHVTLDGEDVAGDSFDTDSFDTARMISIGKCSSCAPGMKLLRMLLTTCDTTASWEVSDSSGRQLFAGNSSRLVGDAAAQHLCQNLRQHADLHYVVPDPYWQDICIDEAECYDLEVSAPWSVSGNMTAFYLFDGDKQTDYHYFYKESYYDYDTPEYLAFEAEVVASTESVSLKIGNCAPTSVPTMAPTVSAAPTSPTASPTDAPTGTPTEFHVSVIDSEWPGQYPATNSTKSVVFNIRTDLFPEDIEWEWQERVSEGSKLWSRLGDGHPTDNEADSLLSYELPVTSGSVYKLEIKETYGDGSCCDYGYGWFTVTTAATAQDNPVGTVVWEALGNEFRDDEISIRLWIDPEGYAHRVKWKDGLGYALTDPDGSVPEEPIIVFRVTQAPTYSPAPSVSVEPSSAPTVRPFDPSLDDADWPGEYPTPVNATNVITVNLRTDLRPQEIQWYWQMRNNDTKKFETLGEPGKPTAEQKNTILSYTKEVQNGSIYQIEVTDTDDDGICCSDGNGWLSVTSAASTKDNPEGTVLRSRTGEGYKGFAFRLWVDPGGYAHAVKYVSGQGYALVDVNGFLPEEPTIVVPQSILFP